MVYRARGCGKCHGSTGMEGPGPELVGPQGEYDGIGSYPFATMIWSYINQMMPLDLQMQHTKLGFIGGRRPAIGGILYEPCCLKPDEVYALTAYLLYRNGIVGEDEVMDAGKPGRRSRCRCGVHTSRLRFSTRRGSRGCDRRKWMSRTTIDRSQADHARRCWFR